MAAKIATVRSPVDRHQRLRAIFDTLLVLDASARERYLDEACGDEPELRSHAVRLLAVHEDVDSFLAQPLNPLSVVPDEARFAGTDRFHVLRQLGAGGMGVVYEVQDRLRGELVALKTLRRAGAADLYRLKREFRSLADVTHPNLVCLYELFVDADRSFFTMERVSGVSFVEYVRGPDRANLSRDRLGAALRQVVEGICELHRRGKLHRDIKPSNVLVGADGEPKLLDFGIAKMLDMTTDTTVTAMRMLTPDYASPEQVTGEPVTTATDIYSLGAVLYKLLTGVSPHRFEGDAAGAIALAISEGKITAPSRLLASLKGDLETIVMKALRREPRERYATIEQFSDDLENYLESRPIRARRGDAWYRTRKFVLRHWIPVAAATLAVAGLATGLAVANHQRAIAQQRFQDVRQLANRLFDIDVEVRKLSGSTRTRQLIVDTSLEYLRRLSANAQKDPDLSVEVGNAYMRVARVQGVPISQNLGQLAQAEQNLKTAESFIQAGLAVQPGNRTAMLRMAQITHDRMLVARSTSRSNEALEWARKSAVWLEKLNAGIGDNAGIITRCIRCIG